MSSVDKFVITITHMYLIQSVRSIAETTCVMFLECRHASSDENIIFDKVMLLCHNFNC